MDWIIFVPTKVLCWNRNPQCDGGRRWGLRKILRSQGWSLHEWHYKRDSRELSGPLPAMWDYKSALQKRSLIRPWSYWHPDLRLPASTTVSDKFQLFISFQPMVFSSSSTSCLTKFGGSGRGVGYNNAKTYLWRGRERGLPWCLSGKECLPRQGTRVPSLGQEGPILPWGVKPMGHS